MPRVRRVAGGADEFLSFAPDALGEPTSLSTPRWFSGTRSAARRAAFGFAAATG